MNKGVKQNFPDDDATLIVGINFRIKPSLKRMGRELFTRAPHTNC